MTIFAKIEQKIAQVAFERFFKKHTTIDFKRSHGGQEISAQIRIFGWLVGEHTLLKRTPNAKMNGR